MSTIPDSVFRAYDIRGIRDKEIDADFVRLLGESLVAQFKSQQVVVGYDARPSSADFAPILIEGMINQGARVLDLGRVPTELVPITAGIKNISEAVIITASHNPPQYVGFKLLTDGGSTAILDANGRDAMKRIMRDPTQLSKNGPKGSREVFDPWPDYRELMFSLVPKEELTNPVSLLAEAGNGMGGALVANLLAGLPIRVTDLLFHPDGTYPVHTPNPMLPEARKIAESKAKEVKHDLTIMFDGDADRGAFLDENGTFIPSDYFDTLIMDEIIHPQYPDSPVVIDYRRGMVTEWAASQHGYKVVRSKAGYPNIKRAMKEHQAVFGFEASAHTMYASTSYSESSGLTLLYMLILLNKTNQSLSELIAPYREQIKLLDEKNYQLDDAPRLFKLLTEQFRAGDISTPDGLTIQFPDWHATVRTSNTEPLVRLCLEAHTDALLEEKYHVIEKIIAAVGGRPSDH